MTKVRFTFVDIQGNPLPLLDFKLLVRRASFNDEDVGVTLPEELNVTTDVDGQVIVELWPLKTAYRIQVAEEYEELCGKLNWAFYVPKTTDIVEAQSLFMVPPPGNQPWDEEAMGKITQAVIDSHNSAVSAEASADRAEAAAVTIEGDADRSEAAAASALSSKNSAEASASTAGNAANVSVSAADSAVASRNAAAGSATAAGNSATSASASAATATTKAAEALASQNSASGSATTATQQAAAALASKNSAETAANTATTKAAEASTSAGTALTQANRAKTEADRATAATDNKQDKHVNLTAFSGLAGAADRLPYFTGAGALSLTVLTAKARLLLARNDTAGMQSELGLVPVTSSIDTTLNRLLTVGYFGLGAKDNLPNDGNALNADNYKTGGTFYGQFTVFSAARVGWLNVESGSSAQNGMQQFVDSGNAATFARVQLAGVWQPWRRIFNDLNSVADPALGGLMSTGSNANGNFMKLANGLLICWQYVGDAAFTAANRYNAGWTFPLPFVGSFPSVFAQGAGRLATTVQSCSFQCFGQNLSAATCAIMQTAGTNIDNVRDLTWFAVGRWQ